MKKRILYILLSLILIPLAALAQSQLGQGMAQYQQFLAQMNSGNTGTAYGLLWQSWQNLSAAAKSVAPGTADYNQLRTTLGEMHLWMEKAYFYNQQQGQRTNSMLFAQAYLDIQQLPITAGIDFERTQNYALIAYNAAASTYNSGDYQRVIPYFKAYLSTGEQKHRRNVLTFMMDACTRVKDYASAKEILDEVVNNNASNVNMLKQAINICMESRDYVAMQRYLTKAISFQPNAADLQKLQAQLYEETQQYEQALEMYKKLRVTNPRSLDLAKHIAICQYNLAAGYQNAAAAGNNVKRNQKLAKEYFTEAARELEEVTRAETGSLKYQQALATAYLYSGQSDKLAAANSRVAAMGGVTVSDGVAPAALAYSSQASASSSPAVASATAPSAQQPTAALPLYSDFAKQYVEERLKKWQAKDPYETTDEYRNRVNEQTRAAKVKELLAAAEPEYIRLYTKDIRFDRDLTLRPYDAENQAFLIESKYGELILPVPRKNNEARSFKNSWAGIQFSNPQFYINGDKLTLAALTFTTPTGKTYQYTADKNLNYTETVVDVQFEKLDDQLFAANSKGSSGQANRQKKKVSVGASDVDLNIPENKATNDQTFAVIICNEHYGMVAPVPMAQNDGTTFAKYCEKTLGLPKENVRLYKDASYGVMLRAMRDIEDIAAAFKGELNVIFYYAGHGIPNEQTKDAYLLPIDADGKQTDGCYSLKKLYSQLGDLKARSVVVFLDACFSGAKRDDADGGGMLMSARGVAIKPHKENPMGNMVIFSAASDDETAMPYREKSHGLFTYYLLKKLQDTKGDVTLAELGEYIKTQVRQKSTVVNHKPQTPSVVPSPGIADSWATMRLRN